MAFLEAYQSETCIWNPKDMDHKDKKKVADAWSRISHDLKKPVKELKAKKEILMTTFRKHFKKKQDSIRSGAGTEDIYKPCWFAFEFMESFLVPVYTCKYTLNTETQSQRDIDEIGNEPGDGEMDNDQDNETPNTSSRTPTFTQKSRRRPAPDLAEQQMAAAFSQLTNVLGRKSERPPQSEEDECDLYGKLLAKKLRELPKDDRQIIMYQIDGLFINRLQLNRETPSPQYSFTRYSSNSNVHRPTSTQSAYSEPYTISHRPSSTQSFYSEPYTSVTAPKRPFPSENLHSVPLHAKLVPKYRRTSSVLPPPPQNAQEIDDNITYAIIDRPPENDDNIITLYSDQLNSSNLQNSKISVTSDQIIVPSSGQNIINEALCSALNDFDGEEN
ncbi:unnamed protein product [Diatraea saccharalis]|uniref:MADF domain-containing protein n=1 Tax=Diatraea saccharalis TaxID=40085 RepID=A0A9N9W8E1_9NEOP|nr:unnamed protein product [Diatraea saccharalis]